MSVDELLARPGFSLAGARGPSRIAPSDLHPCPGVSVEGRCGCPLTDVTGPAGTATFSACMRYRYELTRRFGAGSRLLLWVMLNPSTADAFVLDPTVRRCCTFASRWGFDGIVVRNIYALRATKPAELARDPDPVGPCNDAFLTARTVRDGSGAIAGTVAGWGAHGDRNGRGAQVAALLDGQKPVTLGLTGSGQPRHPLFVPGDTPRQPLPGT